MTDTPDGTGRVWNEAAQTLEPAELELLGTLVRDLSLRVGRAAFTDPGVALLVTEAIDELISHLTSGQQMRQRLERDGFYQRHDIEPPGPYPFTLEEVAQMSIVGTHALCPLP